MPDYDFVRVQAIADDLSRQVAVANMMEVEYLDAMSVADMAMFLKYVRELAAEYAWLKQEYDFLKKKTEEKENGNKNNN